MKVLLPILALLVCVSADDWTVKDKEEMQRIRAECADQHPLSPETRAKLKQHILPNEPAAREYLLCKSLKVGIFDHEHGFFVDRIAKQFQSGLDEEEATRIAANCVETNPRDGKSDDVALYDVHECLQKKITAAVKKHSGHRK